MKFLDEVENPLPLCGVLGLIDQALAAELFQFLKFPFDAFVRR